MPLARTRCVSLLGVEGSVVDVEADVSHGLPGFSLVGLPDAALAESRDRVRSAVVNSGETWPGRRITVSLSPASLPKRGSAFDLAIASAVLASTGAVPAGPLASAVLFGELGLDGRVRPVHGVLPAVMAAVRAGHPRVVVPAGNGPEARLVPDAQVLAVPSLAHFVAWLRGEPVDDDEEDPLPAGAGAEPDPPPLRDLADVRGQAPARAALEVAAAGGHNVLFVGPPGAGKTMLAERLPGILPPLDVDEALEVTAVHSVAGTLPAAAPLVTRPPYASPHHSASVAALVGGGSGLARPGAASLAHRGVLFLDEAPEFPTGALDALRQPLESGEVVISRSGGIARYPSRFILVLAANPCPCGFSSGKGADCDCLPMAKRRYLGRLSGPLLDRIDLRVTLLAPTAADMLDDETPREPSSAVAARVARARARARARFAGTPFRVNADVPGPLLRRRWAAPKPAMKLLSGEMDKGRLGGRGVDRVLRVAWTLADLRGDEWVDASHVHRAVQLRLDAERSEAA